MKLFFVIFLLSLSILNTRSLAFAESDQIGISVALTGTAANWGKDVLNAIKFANEELTKRNYKLIVEDDKCESKEAISIAQKFISNKNIRIVLGHVCSGPLLASAPIYEKNHVIAISAAASAAKLSQAGEYIYRTWPSDEQGIVTLADYIKSRHLRLGVLSEQTDYTQGLLSGLQKNKGNLEVFYEEYIPGTTDFRTLLLRLKQQKIDSIFLNPQGDSSLLPMLAQLSQTAMTIPKYAMYFGASETVRNLGGSDTENLIFADVPQADNFINQEGGDILRKFKAKYPLSFSPVIVLTTIEGFKAADAAIQSGKDPRDFLNSTEFKGTFGKWSFDSNGDIQGIPFTMKKIHNKEIVELAN